MSGKKFARIIEQKPEIWTADESNEPVIIDSGIIYGSNRAAKAISDMPTINDIASRPNIYKAQELTETVSFKQANDTLSLSGESSIGSKRGTASKLLTFALLLAVPAVMTGCNSSSNCNPEYENCSTGSGGGGSGGAYYGGGSYKSSEGHNSSSSSSGVYKGLGSGGTKSSGG